MEKVCCVSFLGTKRNKLSEFSLDHNDKGEEVADETGERGESSPRLSLVGGEDG